MFCSTISSKILGGCFCTCMLVIPILISFSVLTVSDKDGEERPVL